MLTSTKQRILRAALYLFNELGYGNVKVADIANQLDMSAGNLWYHYKDRRAILEALTTLFYAHATKRMKISPIGDDILGEFVNLINEIFNEIAEFRFLYRDQADFGSYGPEADDFLPKVHTRTLEQFQLFISEMKAQGKMAVPDGKVSVLSEALSLQMRYSLEFYREGSSSKATWEEMEKKSIELLCFTAETFMTSSAASDFRASYLKQFGILSNAEPIRQLEYRK